MKILMASLGIILSILLLCSCEKNIVENDNDFSLTTLSGATILYSLADGELVENRINNANSDSILLSNIFPSRNIRISPNKAKIAYIKNSLLHPYFGFQNSGIPSVNISEDLGETEIKLFEFDSESIFLVEWINSNELAVSSKEGSSYFITVLNTEIEVLRRYQVDNLYFLCMLPNQHQLVTYNNNKFGLLNTVSYDFQEFNLDEEIETFNQPFYIDSSIIFSLYNNDYLKFDLTDLTYEIFQLTNEIDRLVYANSQFNIHYNYSDNQLKVYEGIEIISITNIEGYVCKAGLGITEENEFYFIGESTEIDDESAVIKVNLNSDQVTKLSNHGEDNFIYDFKYYDF